MALVMALNLGVRFLLELCILGAVGYWGFANHLSWLAKAGWGIGTPLLIAVLWGSFGAPKAARPLHGLPLLLFELIIFGAAPVALVAAQQPTLATAFVIVYALNKILLFMWHQ